jgi:hypothetical protein
MHFNIIYSLWMNLKYKYFNMCLHICGINLLYDVGKYKFAATLTSIPTKLNKSIKFYNFLLQMIKSGFYTNNLSVSVRLTCY